MYNIRVHTIQYSTIIYNVGSTVEGRTASFWKRNRVSPDTPLEGITIQKDYGPGFTRTRIERIYSLWGICEMGYRKMTLHLTLTALILVEYHCKVLADIDR